MGSLRDVWEAEAENWAAFARAPEHDHYFWRFNLPRFLDLLPPPGRLAVDLGCGEGRVPRLLQARGYQVIGLDASPTLVRLAREEHGPPTVLSDAARVPIRSGVADLGVAFMSLQDVDDLAAVVREAARVLHRGGRLCAAIVHPLNSAGAFEANDETFAIRDSYLKSRPLVVPIERDGLTMTFHQVHRPLETYVGALVDAGFEIEALREPVPDDEHIRDDPRMARWRLLPAFLHLRAVRR
jgi:SAM-dependent methyltransferase